MEETGDKGDGRVKVVCLLLQRKMSCEAYDENVKFPLPVFIICRVLSVCKRRKEGGGGRGGVIGNSAS